MLVKDYETKVQNYKSIEKTLAEKEVRINELKNQNMR